MKTDRIQIAADKLEIQEILSRYAQIADARQWSRLDEVFEKGAIVDFTRNGGERLPYPEIIGYLERGLSIFVAIEHYMTNFVIDVDGDLATCRNYVFTQMVSLVGDTDEIVTDGGWYDSWLRRGPDGWRVTKFVAGLVWLDGRWPEGVPRPAWWGKPVDRFAAD